MGLLDHKRTFRYTVSATPEQCVTAFAETFSSGGVFKGAKWDVRRTANGAAATYQGRSGLVGIMSGLSQTASTEQDGALGSVITFEVEAGGGATICSMWLSTHGSRMGFTNDGRFIRPYMQKVEQRMRALDPAAKVEKT